MRKYHFCIFIDQLYGITCSILILSSIEIYITKLSYYSYFALVNISPYGLAALPQPTQPVHINYGS